MILLAIGFIGGMIFSIILDEVFNRTKSKKKFQIIVGKIK
jgi:hypothetical protein